METFVEARTLFGPALLALADRAAAEGGLPQPDADELLRRATAAFALSTTPVDKQWYDHLERISSVAADIGGVPSTHINHLTPRVLDIDALQARMRSRGIEMIDEIQGPPAWEGPDVLLRQTSFRALAERRTFRYADGTVGTGALRVRFGEVEQRGIALTPRGRDVYDRMVAEVDARVADGAPRPDAAREVWRRDLPRTERELAVRGLAFFTYRATGQAPGGVTDQKALVEAGVLEPEPIVYEDFLPRSAAGIFRSNLAADGTRDEQRTGPAYDIERLSQVLGTAVHDPMDLYTAEQERSLRAAEATLGDPHPEGPGMIDTVTLPTDRTAGMREIADAALRRCGADPEQLPGVDRITVISPVTGEDVATVPFAGPAEVDAAVERAHAAFQRWRTVPAPVRGRLVKRFGELLAEHKEPLADLVGVEVGKIRSEALGEVQEMIDICDLAVGLSRQLEGRTMPSERPGHRLMETWHPLGVVAVISAFNFPVAVWAWNTAIALVCGDTVVWKPSERTPLTAVAASALLDRAAREEGAPEGLNTVVVADPEGAGALVDSPPRPARQRYRIRAHGRRGGTTGRRPVRAGPAGARREQRRGRRAVGGPGPRRARHRVLRCRHGRPAVHHAAPVDRARVGGGQGRRSRGRRLPEPPGRRPVRHGHPRRTAVLRRRLRADAGRARRGRGRRAAPSSPAESGSRSSPTPPTTCVPPWSACRPRPRSSGARRSPRSSGS